MMKRSAVVAAILSLISLGTGCSSQDIPPAHKGRLFDKTGAMAFYAGGNGFQGAILPPGTYYTGVYPEIRTIDCSTRTYKEPLTSMTKDGVQFALDVYITASANCEVDAAVTMLLNKLAPTGAVAAAPAAAGAGQGTPDEKDPVETDPERAVTSRQVYNTYVRPALGEAVRQAISSYDANDINSRREELFGKIKSKLDADLKGDPKLVTVTNFNLSNFKLPDEMANAAADRATQQVLRDKSIAEQERIKVETQTAQLAVAKARAEAEAEAAGIAVVGKALHDNPEYYVRDVYIAAARGGSIVMPSNPNVILQMTPSAKK
jgi:hypothetical protein